MYRILGILNVVLLTVITSPYWLRGLGQRFFPKMKIAATKLMKVLRAIHKPLGVCLLLVTLIHGYLALGALRLHTGTLAGLSVLATVVLGILFFRKRKAVFFKWHKRTALLTLLLTLLHLVVPNALRFLLG